MSNDEMNEEELRALLKPRREPPQTRVTGHWCIFTEKDCRALTLALREKIPNVVFLFEQKEGFEDGYHGYFQVSGLEECANQPYRSAKAEVIVPETPRDVKRLCGKPIPNGISPFPPFSFSLILTTGAYPKTRPDGTKYESRGLTNMYGNYYPSDRDTANFLRRTWRIAGKITHNRWDKVDEETGKRIISKNDLGRWCGFDALRWCQESKDRVLEGRYRPSADWSMPDSPYYD
jgi:hypothetical protein